MEGELDMENNVECKWKIMNQWWNNKENKQ